MSFRTAGIALFAALGLASVATAASAQQTIETYSNFRWADLSPAVCLSTARTAVNTAIAGYGLGGMVASEDTWHPGVLLKPRPKTRTPAQLVSATAIRLLSGPSWEGVKRTRNVLRWPGPRL